MTTSLYDRPIHSKKYRSASSEVGYDPDDVNYDAIRDAKSKFMRNPDKYYPKRIYHGSSNRSSAERNDGRVIVLIEHGGGCTSSGLSNELGLAINDNFPDVRFSERLGRFDSFEVWLNGRCLYSRLVQGGYPEEDEVLEAVYRARAGKKFYPLERGSSTCSIL